MKILYVTTDLLTGTGYGQYGRNLIEMVNEDNEVLVLTHKTSDLTIEELPVLPPPQQCMWRPYKIWKTGRAIKRHIAHFEPDVVHILAEGYIPCVYFVRSQKPIVVTLHGTYARLPETVPKGFRRYLSSQFFFGGLRQLSGFIAVSERTKRVFLEYTGGREFSVSVVRNSVIVPKAVIESQTDDATDLHIITVGEVKKRKGILETIAFFSAWANKRKRMIVYDIVGNYNEDTTFVAEVQKSAENATSLYFKTVFHGRVTDEEKNKLLQSSALYVHLERVTADTKSVEGFGIGIVEAAAYGIPALVAKGSATEEAVQNGTSGYSVDLNQPKLVYATIDDLLLRCTITSSGARSWAREHSREEVYVKIINIYKGILDS